MVLEQEELKKQLKWLIRLRWTGIIGVLVATHVFREIDFLSFSLIPVYAILGFASLYNIYLKWRLRFPNEDLFRLAGIQIFFDQATLALAVYFSGGCDSPFTYFFIFHVVISGIILPWRYTAVVAVLAVFFPAVVMGFKHLGILPHYSIFRNEIMIFSNLSMMGSYGLAFISTVFLTAYFVAYLSRKLHEKNQEVLRLYALSERLRSSIRLNEVIGIIEQEVHSFLGSSKSIYLHIDKAMRRIVPEGTKRANGITLTERNSISDAILTGVPYIIERRVVTSDHEIVVLDLLDTDRCAVLPVSAASLHACYDYFHCADIDCRAYGNKAEKCWQVSGTHCRGAVLRNYQEKLELCMNCELFTPVGALVIDMPQNIFPRSSTDMDACRRLLDASGLAVSNALLYEKTMELSKTDGLTGLKNHREFKDALNAEVMRSKRYRRTFSLLMIDIDHFKHYNDTNGHPQGDVLLKKISELIRDNFKDTDIVARYGGEEFAVILLETETKDHAVSVAERMRAMVEWCKFPKEETQPLGKVTISIGVSCYPEDGSTADEILQAADKALYCAKREGKNRVVAFSSKSMPLCHTSSDDNSTGQADTT